MIVTFINKQYELFEGENLLTGLLMRGAKIPYACRRGICHSCLIQVVSGNIPQQSQRGLSDQEKSNKCILACQTHIVDTLHIRIVQSDYIKALITEIKPVETCSLVTLTSKQPLPDHQSTIILLHGNEKLEVSVTPLENNKIKFSISRIIGKKITHWLIDTAKPGDTLDIKIANTTQTSYTHKTFNNTP